MNGAWRHPLRCAIRSTWLGAELFLAAFDLAVIAVFGRRSNPILARALGMQRHARRLLRVVSVNVTVTGHVPTDGLLVSNHVSYLDILVLGSIVPSVFISKSEVERWPVLGWLTRLAGTLFIQRQKRLDVARVNEEATHVLDAGVLLVIFPEGTSSNGCEVLPFKSSLLEPAVTKRHPLSIAHVSYEIADGNAGEDVCYWGDMNMGSHLLKLLTKHRVDAFVTFAPVEEPATGRKELARELHSKISRLKASSRSAANMS